MQQWRLPYKLKNRPYVIEEEIGQGGFGITYRAEDLTLGIVTKNVVKYNID